MLTHAVCLLCLGALEPFVAHWSDFFSLFLFSFEHYPSFTAAVVAAIGLVKSWPRDSLSS